MKQKIANINSVIYACLVVFFCSSHSNLFFKLLKSQFARVFRNDYGSLKKVMHVQENGLAQ